MNRFILAVYDNSPGYVNRFLKNLKTTGSFPFDTAGFTSPSALEDFISRAVVNILLLSLSGDETEETEINKIICHENIKRIVYLGEQPKREDGKECIYKYQSVREIISALLDICGDAGSEIFTADINMDIYGVYSLEGASEKINTALALAESLNDESRTLYIETERFSGLGSLSGQNIRRNLSDIIYLYKTNPSRLRDMLGQAICHYSGTDILVCSNTPYDLDELEPESWANMLQRIAACGGYEAIVIGISDSLRDLEFIFSLCRTVYFLSPTQEEGGSGESLRILSQRMKEFDLFFGKRERGDLLEKIIPVDPAQPSAVLAK